jgi:hypothetical protein
MVLHREASPGTHNYDPIKRRESRLPELAAATIEPTRRKNGEINPKNKINEVLCDWVNRDIGPGKL